MPWPFEIDFQWPVDEAGYKVVDVPRRVGATVLTSELGGLTLQPRSGRFRTINPLALHKHLYVDFARIDPDSPADIEKFATAFGFLDGPEGGAERLDEWRKHIAGMAGLLAARDEDRLSAWLGSFAEAHVATANIVLRTGSGASPPQLVIRPRNLLGAIRLQFVQDLAFGREARACLCCGALFYAGGDSGRRAGAKFCSDKCRIKFNNRIDVRTRVAVPKRATPKTSRRAKR